ncbi:hypothetical protein [Streptomyces sp. NPDC003023]|uniref:hypothetical protein n=1 Tax=Streptomyces sp. NPDC003023 TaxID=3364675 RepID=UPI003695BECA
MCDLIQALVLWAKWMFAPPGTGRHRFRPGGPVPPRPVRRDETPWRLPATRSPYGIEGALDGGGTVMVRPYVVADERRQRRLALVLAADFGVDLDVHLVGARGAA